MALDDRAVGGSHADPANRDAVEPRYHEPNTGRSNFAAFLLSGAFLAAGLLGYLYYDMTTAPRLDSLTTGSVTRPHPGPRPIHAPDSEPSRGPVRAP